MNINVNSIVYMEYITLYLKRGFSLESIDMLAYSKHITHCPSCETLTFQRNVKTLFLYEGLTLITKAKNVFSLHSYGFRLIQAEQSSLF